MIQSSLLFLLGFIAASFLALLVAPAVWRRAEYLTRKRIESSVPLSVNELQAGKDRLRAEHAMALRKLEMKLAANNDKSAEREAHIGRQSEQIRLLTQSNKERDEEVSNLARVQAELEANLAAKDNDIAGLTLRTETMAADLSARTGELETFRRISSEGEKRIALMVERLEQAKRDEEKSRVDLAKLRDKRQEEQGVVRDNRTKLKEIELLLKNERERVAKLEEQLEKAVRQATSLEEKLARRERDFARKQESMSMGALNVTEYEVRANDAEAERAVLEKELAAMTLAYNRLEKQAKAPSASNKASSEAGDAQLRAQVNQLAAEMVHLTALLEGDDSAIHALLAKAPKSSKSAKGEPSLADRIIALRTQAANAAQ